MFPRLFFEGKLVAASLKGRNAYAVYTMSGGRLAEETPRWPKTLAGHVWLAESTPDGSILFQAINDDGTLAFEKNTLK